MSDKSLFLEIVRSIEHTEKLIEKFRELYGEGHPYTFMYNGRTVHTVLYQNLNMDKVVGYYIDPMFQLFVNPPNSVITLYLQDGSLIMTFGRLVGDRLFPPVEKSTNLKTHEGST